MMNANEKAAYMRCCKFLVEMLIKYGDDENETEHEPIKCSSAGIGKEVFTASLLFAFSPPKLLYYSHINVII